MVFGIEFAYPYLNCTLKMQQCAYAKTKIKRFNMVLCIWLKHTTNATFPRWHRNKTENGHKFKTNFINCTLTIEFPHTKHVEIKRVSGWKWRNAVRLVRTVHVDELMES